MMMIGNSKERSLAELKTLGSVYCLQHCAEQDIRIMTRSHRLEAGLEFVKVWDIIENAMVEFKLAM
jgi:hypothetical protein